MIRICFLLLLILSTAHAQDRRRAMMAQLQRGGSSSPAAYTDDFNRADSGTLGANWTAVEGAGLAIVSNEAKGTLTTSLANIYTAGTFANNQYSKVTIRDLASGAKYAEVGVRMSGTGASLDGYILYADSGTGAGHTEVVRIDDGVQSAAILVVADSFTLADVLEIRASGTTISVWKNGSMLDSVVDATYGSGKAGVRAYSTAAFDDWAGGDL